VISAGSVGAISIDALPSAPNYTAPVVTGDTQEITGTITAGAIGTTADFTNFEHWFDVLADMIETEEDTELASSQIQKISTYIGAYGQAMQNQLNIFNEGNVVYQAAIQRNLEQARINMQDAQKEADLTLKASIQTYTFKLQRYQNSISEYQANISKEVQQYQQKLSRYQLELNNTFQAWQTEEANKHSRHQADLGEYQTNIQNALNIFNKENAIYQADIQENIKEADLLDAHEARKLQKYQAETQVYSAEVNSNVQKFTQDLANYNAKIQKHTVDYQWLQGQYALLKKDYMDGLQVLKGGGVSPQQQGGR
jgi:hypothetical protein